jgi:hydroxypyruvate isomerase
MQRRTLLKHMALGSLLVPVGLPQVFANELPPAAEPLKGNIRHSVCRWTYDQLSLEELCLLVKKIGFTAIDLVEPKEFPILKKYGIDSSMCTGAHISLTEGWNDPKNHPVLIENYLKYIDLVADAGYKNLICFSGNRNGMPEDEGLKNCVNGLKQIMPKAEKRGVIIQLELFNSKVNHPDYMADSSRWGIQLCKALGSENFKLLYDIYHMQIMEGDIIHTIQENHHYFGHYHTAGVPGRHELNELQELNYPAIMNAIHATGYQGYVAQEFIPTASDKNKALAEAVQLCDI